MRRLFTLSVLLTIALCAQAQFMLTPSNGLMTADGGYTISRTGSESENYYAAKTAIQAVIPEVEIADVDYEKSFIAKSVYKHHGRMPGAAAKTDWFLEYALKIEASDDGIIIFFEKTGDIEYQKKGHFLGYVHPTTGSNSLLSDIAGHHYIFNSKGEVARMCKKLVAFYEDFANNLVKDIEEKL